MYSTNGVTDFYAIVYDPSRIEILDGPDESEDDGPIVHFIIDFDEDILVIVFILLVIAFICPCIAICLDNSDYNALKDDSIDISADIMKSIAHLKNEPLEKILYRKK